MEAQRSDPDSIKWSFKSNTVIIVASSIVTQLESILMLYKVLGILFVGLAAAGAVLPVLPTTPFLILAASCFAKSSKKWYQWLLNNKQFGPAIRDWEEHRAISKKSRYTALTMVFIFGGYSVFFALNNVYLQIMVSLILAYGIYFICSIKGKESITENFNQ